MPGRLSRSQWERFLRERRVCVLGTVAEDGAPVLTPIWYLYEGGRILMRTAGDSLKVRNMRQNPSVSVCVQDERPPYRSITVYGEALIEPEKPELAARMARRYLGAIGGAAYLRVAAEQVQAGAQEVTVAVTPVRVLSQDFSAETPWYGRLWLYAKRVLPPWL